MNETLDAACRAAAPPSPSPSPSHGARTRPGPSGRDADLLAEEVLFFNEPASGLRCIIAIDPAGALPALGACSLVAGLDDLRALQAAVERARRTTRKLLLAQLPFAGAHAVLRRPPGALDRPALLAAFGRAVSRAEGRYVALAGGGTSAQDMLAARGHSPFVADVSGDDTFSIEVDDRVAFGVFIAMEEALQRLGRRLHGSTVAVSGVEGAGMPLCERLHDAGAALLVCDADPFLAHEAWRRFGARVFDARDLASQRCDVFAPCTPGALDAQAVARISAALVCGSADAPLADARDADALHDRGVMYLPDVLVNAGGLVAAACSRRGADARQGLREIAAIGRRVHDLFDQLRGRAPHRLVDEWIDARRSAGVAGRGPGDEGIAA